MVASPRHVRFIATLALVAAASPSAEAAYWNVFNIEGEATLTAQIVTYGTLADMRLDQNRTGVFDPNTPGFGRNIVDSDSDGTNYWNVFNIERESTLTAQIATYSTLADMLSDQNRTGVFDPNTPGFGRNVVGTGSDGTSYWNVFNIEGESTLTAQIVTYGTLVDMLSDQNRTGVFDPNTPGFGRNIVDSGSDGTSYWNVFNIEGESTLTAQIVTYGTLADMLSDQNRTGVFDPNTPGFGRNVVGSGSDVRIMTDPDPPVVDTPEPASVGLMAGGMLLLGLARRPRRTPATGPALPRADGIMSAR